MTTPMPTIRPNVQELITDTMTGSFNAFYQLFHQYYLKNQLRAEEKSHLLKQVESNNPALLAFYARMLLSSNKKDAFAQAVKFSEQAAESGDANGFFNLGLAYQHGLGVPIDEAKALKFFECAASQQHAEALQQTAWFYAKEGKTPEAHRCYEQAARFGLALSLNNQAFLYEQAGDFATAILLYEQAISRGQLEAMVNRARLHRTAGEHKKALQLYHLAANAGDVIAMAILSEMYEHGEGGDCNLAMATQLYRQALLHTKHEQDKKLITQHLERLKIKGVELAVQYHAALALKTDVHFPPSLLIYFSQQPAELVILLLSDSLLSFREKQHYFNSILHQTKLIDLLGLIQKSKPNIAKQAINLIGDYFLKRTHLIIGIPTMPEDGGIEKKICSELTRIPTEALCYREALQILADTTYSMKLLETSSMRLAFRFARYYHDLILQMDLKKLQEIKPLPSELITLVHAANLPDAIPETLLTERVRTSWLDQRFNDPTLNDIQKHVLIYLERMARAKSEVVEKFFVDGDVKNVQPTTTEDLRLDL